jgi:molecular chaperone Hsp33
MDNYRLRSVCNDLNLRGVAVLSTHICEEARRRMLTAPLATAALGRTITAALLAGTMVKDKHKIGLQFRGSGPLKEVYADCDGIGRVRGYVAAPDAALELAGDADAIRLPNVNRGLGAGVLSVTSDLGLRERYQGVVPILFGDIAGDLGHYFETSAQIPSYVNIGLWLREDGSVEAAGGLMVQKMPGASDTALGEIDGNLLGLPPLLGMFQQNDAPHQILRRVFAGFNTTLFEPEPITYYCPCNRERVERTLIALGEEELQDMKDTDRGANIRCEFCNEQYDFTAEDLDGLLSRSKK